VFAGAAAATLAFDGDSRHPTLRAEGRI
jgi:hypothetical protein